MPTPLTDQQSAALTDAELADLRARVATASAEGTWAHQCMGSEGCIIHIPADSVRTRRPHIARFGHGEWARDHTNAEYVADMHAAMPRLLDDNARLRAELERARADVRRLAHAAENGKHSLAAFVSDSSDPGSAALGALYLLRGALAGQPDTEPAYLEVTPEALRAAHFREAARLLEDADLDDDAVNLLDNVARGIADAAPACSCRAEAVHQAGCDTAPHA